VILEQERAGRAEPAGAVVRDQGLKIFARLQKAGGTACPTTEREARLDPGGSGFDYSRVDRFIADFGDHAFQKRIEVRI
jgi:hypothetical protein